MNKVLTRMGKGISLKWTYMNQKNKRYLILFVGIIVFFIIFAGIIFLQNSKQLNSSSSSQTQPTVSLQQTDKNTSNAAPSVSLAPPASTPRAAAQEFYTYYFSASINPLANGSYKNNPYLTSEFKTTIGQLYDNGNAPLFCGQNKRENVIIGKEQTVYYNNSYLTQEVISEAPPGTKDLYRLLLENVNGKWLIFDIDCI